MKAWSVCLAAAGLAAALAGSAIAAPSRVPVLSLICGQRDGRGLVACQLGGRGFQSAEPLVITYDRTGSGKRVRYVRHIRADDAGAFSRPPVAVSLPPNYLLTVTVKGQKSLPAMITMGSTQSAILSWTCGLSAANNRTPCTLAGHGFHSGEMIAFSYSVSTTNARGKIMHHTYRTQQRASYLGTFNRPPIFLQLGRCYAIGVNAVAPSALSSVSEDVNIAGLARGCH